MWAFIAPNINSPLNLQAQQKIVVGNATAVTSYSLPSPCTENPNVGYLQKNSPELTFQDQLRLAGIEVKNIKDDGGKGIGMSMTGSFFLMYSFIVLTLVPNRI